jgi:hypothetical protein
MRLINGINRCAMSVRFIVFRPITYGYVDLNLTNTLLFICNKGLLLKGVLYERSDNQGLKEYENSISAICIGGCLLDGISPGAVLYG